MPRILLFLAIGLLARVSGLPNGAPPKTCSNLTPHHENISPQTSYPPYQVLPAAGQGRVRLILGSPKGLAYQGFMILARDIDTGEFVGEFTNLPDSARIVECIQGVKVLHWFLWSCSICISNRSEKINKRFKYYYKQLKNSIQKLPHNSLFNLKNMRKLMTLKLYI